MSRWQIQRVGRGFVAAWLIAVMGTGAACMSSSEQQLEPAGNAATDDGGLEALTSADVIGPLFYGETSSPITYANPARYRAFSFDGGAGDNVDISVRSPDGIPFAWLVRADGTPLAWNFAVGRNAYLAHTLEASGKYLVVFREATLARATFTVMLGTSSSCTPTGDASGGGIEDAGADASADADAVDASGSDAADGGSDAATDGGSPDASAADAGSPSDGGADGSVSPSSSVTCTFTRTISSSEDCSACDLPSPEFVQQTNVPIVIDSDTTGGYRIGAPLYPPGPPNMGPPRILHIEAPTVFAWWSSGAGPNYRLEGAPPHEVFSGQGTVGLASTYSGSMVVENGNEATVDLRGTSLPGGLTHCPVIRGCVTDSFSCTGSAIASTP